MTEKKGLAVAPGSRRDVQASAGSATPSSPRGLQRAAGKETKLQAESAGLARAAAALGRGHRSLRHMVSRRSRRGAWGPDSTAPRPGHVGPRGLGPLRGLARGWGAGRDAGSGRARRSRSLFKTRDAAAELFV